MPCYFSIASLWSDIILHFLFTLSRCLVIFFSFALSSVSGGGNRETTSLSICKSFNLFCGLSSLGHLLCVSYYHIVRLTPLPENLSICTDNGINAFHKVGLISLLELAKSFFDDRLLGSEWKPYQYNLTKLKACRTRHRTDSPIAYSIVIQTP